MIPVLLAIYRASQSSQTDTNLTIRPNQCVNLSQSTSYHFLIALWSDYLLASASNENHRFVMHDKTVKWLLQQSSLLAVHGLHSSPQLCRLRRADPAGQPGLLPSPIDPHHCLGYPGPALGNILSRHLSTSASLPSTPLRSGDSPHRQQVTVSTGFSSRPRKTLLLCWVPRSVKLQPSDCTAQHRTKPSDRWCQQSNFQIHCLSLTFFSL